MTKFFTDDGLIWIKRTALWVIFNILLGAIPFIVKWVIQTLTDIEIDLIKELAFMLTVITLVLCGNIFNKTLYVSNNNNLVLKASEYWLLFIFVISIIVYVIAETITVVGNFEPIRASINNDILLVYAIIMLFLSILFSFKIFKTEIIHVEKLEEKIIEQESDDKFSKYDYEEAVDAAKKILAYKKSSGGIEL